MKVFHLSLLLIFLLISCNDEMETEGQLTAKKIQADISSSLSSIQSISAKNIYDGRIFFEGSSYKITSDGFIVISTTLQSLTLNLGELKSYLIFNSTLTLYY